MNINRHYMKSKNTLFGLSIAVALQLGMVTGSAQATKYLYSGYETNITLAAGTYIITAYGAHGGGQDGKLRGGVGAEMSAEFSPTFATGSGFQLFYSWKV